MKRFKYFLPAFAIIASVAGYFILRSPVLGNPLFYLGTDRSFGADETAYVNLEGNGRNNYEFRVYRIADPKKFLTKKVKERLVQEDNENAFGNPLALFSRTLRKFQNEFRSVARREFNSNTRSELKKISV